MKAIIEVDVPDYQIGQEVSIYFKDTMMKKGVVQEPNGDLISRQATLEPYKILNDTDTLCVAVIRANIMQQPSVKQEPKTGHWILDETDNSITCDNCGCLIWANDISNGEAYYCPNCGAKME